MKSTRHLRSIPSVEVLLQALGDTGVPRPTAVAVVRRQLAALRNQDSIPEFAVILDQAKSALRALSRMRIQPVINATGVIVHTNLGRAPLGGPVVSKIQSIAANYNNLEFEIDSGERGGRAGYLEHNLALLCGAESATVVNNCAAALVLALRHFTAGQRKEVIISRGELVQIGGGFRIPEILEASGAILREVGTTNKTSLNDYARGIGKDTALILKVHRSNFFMSGFVESPHTEELADLARRKRIPLLEDLGSGAVLPTEKLSVAEHEPTPAEVLKRGVNLVTFSGDKLLGGPQAGIVAGSAKLLTALKREPFFRALRCDKLILSALETTVDLYLEGTARETVPVASMMAVQPNQLRTRAEKIITGLETGKVKIRIATAQSQIGGGTLPRSTLESIALELHTSAMPLTSLAARFRHGSPPVIGYVSGGRFKLDLRTVLPHQDDELRAVIAKVLAEIARS